MFRVPYMLSANPSYTVLGARSSAGVQLRLSWPGSSPEHSVTISPKLSSTTPHIFSRVHGTFWAAPELLLLIMFQLKGPIVCSCPSERWLKSIGSSTKRLCLISWIELDLLLGQGCCTVGKDTENSQLTCESSSCSSPPPLLPPLLHDGNWGVWILNFWGWGWAMTHNLWVQDSCLAPRLLPHTGLFPISLALWCSMRASFLTSLLKKGKG